MSRTRSKPAPFPSREEILQFVNESPRRVGKREIARAFRLDAEQKRDLKKVLREMELDGTLSKDRGRRLREAGNLPAVGVLIVGGLDDDGDRLARPVNWEGPADPPPIYLERQKRGRPAPAPGERVLARLGPTGDGAYSAKIIRKLQAPPETVLGIFDVVDGSGRIRPTDRRAKSDLVVRTGDSLDARPGDLVRAETVPGRKLGLPQARVTERLEKADGAASISLISLHEYDIPTTFPSAALRLAEHVGPAAPAGREDLRALPLVTIDGADARDFDDAVWAEPDADPDNRGGWHIVVAIADVAWYVRPGDALDREAFRRGNSVYFPDRVVPMLPEALSNGWCSLMPNEDRPCLAAHLWIGAGGKLRRHRFVRGLMRSHARLTYSQVQAARDGDPDVATVALVDTVVAPLYGAFAALARNRARRGALELEIPERRVRLADDGTVLDISERQRLDSHKLIEEFMIAANVAAADTLEKLKQPCMYRVHDQPPPDRIEGLSQFLGSLDLAFDRGQVPKPAQFNRVLRQVADGPRLHMVSQMVLRAQAQAEYSTHNIGHFGLALRRYSHFTSPIRRYADLLVHRALIAGLKLGDGGLERQPVDFAEAAEHITVTERRAVMAERAAVDRFAARFLADRVGAAFPGRINGVTRFGVFVTLDETGADGLVPMRALPDDFYDHDQDLGLLRGRRSGVEFRIGQPVEVLLHEVNPITGGLVFGLLESGRPGPVRRRGGRPGKVGRAGAKPGKAKRSAKRRGHRP